MVMFGYVALVSALPALPLLFPIETFGDFTSHLALGHDGHYSHPVLPPGLAWHGFGEDGAVPASGARVDGRP
uniref:Putative secreted protein n=1 Tax=Ixodes ricinus TaxID=34613 RepID=A0A6B0U2C7_IXORI